MSKAEYPERSFWLRRSTASVGILICIAGTFLGCAIFGKAFGGWAGYFIMLSSAPALASLLTVRRMEICKRRKRSLQLQLLDLILFPIYFAPIFYAATRIKPSDNLPFEVILLLYGLAYQTSFAGLFWSYLSKPDRQPNFMELILGAYVGAGIGYLMLIVSFTAGGGVVL